MHLTFSDRVAGKASATPHLSTPPVAPSGPSKASSLARAFTTSAKNKDKASDQMGRSSSQRTPLRPSQISLPIALISTTNMLSYDAPDIVNAPLKKQQIKQQIQQQQDNVLGGMPTRKASTVSSATSDASSVRSRHSNASHTTAATSLSVEGFSPESPEQNHLSCYFKQSGPQQQTQASLPPPPQSRMSGNAHYGRRSDSLGSNIITATSPQVPSRAPSHSMKAHVLSHKRSVSRVGTSPQTKLARHDSIASHESSETSASALSNPSSKSATSPHPFGKELEQLNEIAEEFSSAVRDG